MPSVTESRDVRISVPARADYLVLARLTLSALCRLTPLGHNDVADLKLAITEAAAGMLPADGGDEQIEFRFQLGDGSLALELDGPAADVPAAERELSEAIVAATVDQHELDPGRARMLKRFE